jgi:transposase
MTLCGVSVPARPAPRRGRPRPARLAALLAAALLAALAALALAGPASAVYRPGDDWRHVEATLKALNRNPPRVPVIYLLGGSAARECITTEPAWSDQIRRLGGGRVRALDFGSSSQAFKHGVTIVGAAPAVPSIVLIGLNVGRYTSVPPEDALPVTAPRTARAATVYDSHRFHAGQQLSDAAKRALVSQWLRVKYPRFRERYAGNAAVLRELITVCQDKGFYPVLVELPLNLAIVGHSWDGARTRYHRGARSAARAAGIPRDDFVARIGLVSGDFIDLSHLVESGRAKYQRRLSRLVVAKLKQYGLTQ